MTGCDLPRTFESRARRRSSTFGRAVRAVPILTASLVLLVAAVVWAGSMGTRPGVSGSEGHPAAVAAPSAVSPSPSRPTPAGSHTPTSSQSLAFDRYVADATQSLARAGVPEREIHPPNTGRPAEVVNGVVVPGNAVAGSNVTPFYTTPPVPAGIAYYGENDTTGAVQTTTLDASSVAGTLTVNQLSALYLDDDVPDMWGIQLNTMLTNVTIQGIPGNVFWVQNTVDYIAQHDSVSFGEATWNFSSPTVFGIPANGTIESHNPNGSNIQGIYIGEGPTFYAPMPFTLTLFVNSSLTAEHDQELWYNYSLTSAGGPHEAGNYDWIVFNSTNAHHPATVPLASFTACGTHLSPGGLIEDYELDFGIGPEDGAPMDVLAANATATLDYCPISIASCTPGEFRAVPAALDFGTDTGEATEGVSIGYNGTTALASAGPLILHGLWGYSAALGPPSGVTRVANDIRLSGSPVVSAGPPYVFVFFNGSTFIDPRFEWAPDVPVWYLPPGTYGYEVMLADYGEVIGTLSVGSTPTSLSVTLAYHPSSGVYTPLWALDNAELAGISSSGNGTLTNQFELFNNPTSGCTQCGNATDGNLSPSFFPIDSFLFPVFPGLLLDHTDLYVDVDHPPNFGVYRLTYGPRSDPLFGPTFYLQVWLVWTHNVTLANATEAGGWPGMPELATLAGIVNASVNPFPQANVMVWNSTHDLFMSNTFVSSPILPNPETNCTSGCPSVSCYSFACVSPDGLLLYGGTNNTVWGNTFEDPHAPPDAAPQTYAGLAEAESGDLIFNNNFSVDNPAVLMPFDIYNNSCPAGFSGDCAPPLPPTYVNTWNVTPQPADRVAATVNGFPLSGDILGGGCRDQGGNFWATYGNELNPLAALPFADAYNYSALGAALPSWWAPVQLSIQIGGDYAPLYANLSTSLSCVASVYLPAPTVFHPSLVPEFAALSVSAATGIGVGVGVFVLARRRARMAAAVGGISGDVIARGAEELPVLAAPSFRERLARRPPGLGLVVGAGLLVSYLGVALSALFVFPTSLNSLPENAAWAPLENPIGPSWSHPFGIMPGWGTDLFDAIWRATPWDLAIVAGILAIDAALGFGLGAVAGLNEGGAVDAVVTFVCDSLGSIPSFLLAIVVFAGLFTVAPGSVGLPLFVAVFGVILWPTMARTVRERARTIAHQPYVEAARASGSSFFRILRRHILPNSLGPVLAQVPLDIVPIFFVLSAFPWWYNCELPGGPVIPPYTVPPPYLVPYLPPFSPLPSATFPEWGFLLGFGTCEGFGIPGGFDYWWMYFFPLLAIVGLGLALGLLCDGIERWRHFDR